MERQQKMTNRILLLSPLQAALHTPPPGIEPGTLPPLVSYRLLRWELLQITFLSSEGLYGVKFRAC